ncbi:hypothetical protein B0J13DRAFT_584271 [Dactylonectria estremocensis]|uniref:Flavin-nucleotide-binding protein n=1 Tax=Dactylonectria estremocensis TaxID=1079267 RepID=A0A9P9EWW3_9HYPO|nr:hypothetical protein B0J13DRAFT_584271 [Dactylonectria estremocensis]
MGNCDLEYPKVATNTVKRLNERGTYALETIHRIVNSSQILHISFNTPSQPFPVILPMIGQMGSFDRPSADLGDPLNLYLHGYVSSRIMNLGCAGSEGEEKGMPVCVAASHVDCLVEKLYVMEPITDSVVPDRWRHTRLPPTKAELQSMGILKVRIASGSAKIRAEQAHDNKNDMENEVMRDSVWTGVLPVQQTIGEPLVSPYDRVDVPGYISEFIKDFNEDNQQRALNVAKDQ